MDATTTCTHNSTGNSNSQNLDGYCLKDNFVIIIQGKIIWKDANTYLEPNTDDFANIIVNKIAEKYSKPNSSTIIPEQAKSITRSWVEGSISQSEFLQKIQQLLDSNQMIIPYPDSQELNYIKVLNGSDWMYMSKDTLTSWVKGTFNQTFAVGAFQDLIANKYLIEKSWENKSATNQNSTIQNVQSKSIPVQNETGPPTQVYQGKWNNLSASNVTTTSSNSNDMTIYDKIGAITVFIVIPIIIIVIVAYKIKKYLAKRRNNKLQKGM